MDKIFRRSIRWVPKIIFCLVFVLFLLHLFYINILAIDNTTIFLIGLLLLIPFSGSLKKIKFGEFEAEIEPNEVKKIEAEIQNIPKTVQLPRHEVNKTIENITVVLDNDHILSLARLRIELEKILFKILSTEDQNKPHKQNITGVSSILRHLENTNLIQKQYIPLIKDVIAICNRAIHGEEVSKSTAERIVNIGVDLLERLYKDYYDLIIEPTQSEKISPKERDEYLKAKYHVTTIVPLAEGPYTNKYIFNRDQLDQFLEGYNEFAEFLAEIRKIS